MLSVNRAHPKLFAKDVCAKQWARFMWGTEKLLARMDTKLQAVDVQENHQHLNFGKTLE